jgi:hypothetical protein
MLLQQEIVAAPSWVGPTMAVSLAVVALAVVVFTGAVALLAFKVINEIQERKLLLTGVRQDVQETLSAVRQVAEQAQEVMGVVRTEAGAFVETGRRIRRKVNRGVDRVERRLEDLEALYDVMHEEVEDTALEMASAVRKLRRGGGMVGRVRRYLVPGR